LVQEVIWDILAGKAILATRVQKVILERWVTLVLLDIQEPTVRHPILAQLDLEDLQDILEPKEKQELRQILVQQEPLDPKERREPLDIQELKEILELQDIQESKEILEPQEQKEKQVQPPILVRLEQQDSQDGLDLLERKDPLVLHLIQGQPVLTEKLDLQGQLVLTEKQVELDQLVQEG
jgi:hypothetical protein